MLILVPIYRNNKSLIFYYMYKSSFNKDNLKLNTWVSVKEKLDRDMKSIKSWFELNKLTLSIDKTQYLIHVICQ